jgi:hypothetical protein
LYAATWTEYVLLEEDALAAFGIVAIEVEVTSVFTVGDGGEGGDAGFAGTESNVLTSLAPLPPVTPGADGAAAVTAGTAAGVVSMAGGFAEATVVAGDGHRWP